MEGFESCMKGFSCMEGFESCMKGFSCMKDFHGRIMHERVFMKALQYERLQLKPKDDMHVIRLILFHT